MKENGSDDMEEKILKAVESLREDLINAVGKMVAIPSIQEAKTTNAPYGKNVRMALDTALEISKTLGFKTHQIRHRVGYVYTKKGDDYVGVFGHLDVVPENGEWKYEPFQMSRENGKLYGRGVLDNKGPTMAALFALKALKDLSVELSLPVRIVFGCNEESGMQDMAVYLKHEKAPLCGFTPDCKYPPVYSERGRRVFEIRGSQDKIIEFLNMYVLGSNDIAKRLGIDEISEIYGRVEIKGPKLLTKNGHPFFRATLLYPYDISLEKIEKIIQSKLENGLTYHGKENIQPMHHDPNDEMMQALSKAYTYVSHMDGSAVTTSGGTYAKVVPNIVPFGPSFPGQKGIAHLPDEWMDEEDLIMNCQIYALALYYLAK